ncbi:MAG: methyltransferase [Pseudomonadota bacterium]
MINAPTWLEWLTFGLSASGAAAIFALSAVSAVRPNFKFFPPPSKQSWQHRTFLALFRLHLYPLVALTILVIRPATDTLGWAQISLGSAMAIIGFGLAIRITLQMGWRNAFGEKRGLQTTGWFARSRNPIYVATWIGLIGWGLAAADIRVAFLLGLWAFMYWLAPRFEEPWLEEQYGDSYLAYKGGTPRFI